MVVVPSPLPDASRLPSDALLAGLTDAQARAVVTDASPLCVLAAAGAGKTRVLTRRIAYRALTGRADPARVLALTFTRKAAGELAGRVRALGLRDRVATGTFHAVAAAQLRRWWADRGQAAPVLLERRARLLGPLAAARPALAGVPLAELAAHLDWARARGIAPDELGPAAAAAGRPLPVPAEEMAALMVRYGHEKRRRGVVDFDDLLERCAAAIEDDPQFAAAQRWRWRHVFVDEFQDVNPLQHRLLCAWLGDEPDLCVVGDPNQAIYGWNGADPGLLDGLPQRWPSTEVVRLDANHRCTPQVVAAAASVLGPRGGRLVSSRPDGHPVTVDSYADDATEAAAVARSVADAHRRGARWSSLAVLARTNAQAAALADACRAAGVPVRVPGAADLLSSPAARGALAELGRAPGAPLTVAVHDLAGWAAAAAGDDSPSRLAAGDHSPSRLAAGDDSPSRLAAGDGRRSAAGDGSPSRLAAGGGRRSGVAGAPSPGDGEEAAVLEALAELARQAAAIEESLTVGAWVASLPAQLGGEDGGGRADTVTICSFHRSKGLEWPEVWVVGLEDGLVPIGRADTPAAQDEERRLLYVALTRGADRVHCSWARSRRFGAALVPRSPSPWLPAGPTAPSAAEDAPTQEEWQERVAASRRRLAAGVPRSRRRRSLPPGWPDPDEGALQRLTAWRAATARAAAVPAHVVLHDTTLAALAASRPVDEAGLLAVPGLGPVKASRYGDTLLALVRPGT